MSWNVVLQVLDHTRSSPPGRCQRGTLAGLAAPARIAVVSLGSDSDVAAFDLDRELATRLAASAPLVACGAARLANCISENEPACTHVLVLLIGAGSCPIAPAIEILASDWLKMAPGRARVVPVLMPGASFATAIPGGAAFPNLSLCAFATWSTPAQVAAIVLEAALVRDRPAAFISYVRREATPAADALHDALARRGYRIFLDRFAGTPGRAFPQEIAEEMAECGVAIALETPRLLTARWTRWEVAFARLYGIGIVALNFAGAPQIAGVSARHVIGSQAATGLGPSPDTAVDFVATQRALADLKRRAMYQAIVAAAATAGRKSGARVARNATQIVTNVSGADRAVVLAAGRPGRLRDARLLDEARLPPPVPAILAGQHAHLPVDGRFDLGWLAATASIELRGRGDIYRRVRQIARTTP